MTKFFSRFLILLVVSLLSIVIYLSYFGLETDKFNNLIKGKADEAYTHAKLEFKNTKIYLNPKEFNLAVKLQNPKILIKNNEINLSKIDLFLDLKSFITSDFFATKGRNSIFQK